MFTILSILTFETKAQPISYDSLREFNNRIIQSFLFDDESRLVIAGSGGNHGFTGSYFGIYDTTQANYQLLADTVYTDNVCGASNGIEDVILHPQGGYVAAVNRKDCTYLQYGLLWLNENAQEIKYSAIPGYDPYSWDYGQNAKFTDILIRDDGHFLCSIRRDTKAPGTDNKKVVSIAEFDENLNFIEVHNLENNLNHHVVNFQFIGGRLFVYGKKNPKDSLSGYPGVDYPNVPYLAELDPFDFSILQSKEFQLYGGVEVLNSRNNELLISWIFDDGKDDWGSRLTKVNIDQLNVDISETSINHTSDYFALVKQTEILNETYAVSFVHLSSNLAESPRGNYIFLHNYKDLTKIDSIWIESSPSASFILDVNLRSEGLFYVFNRLGSGSTEYLTEFGMVRTQAIVSTQDLSAFSNMFVDVYPNPVRKGGTYTVKHSLKFNTESIIEVSDLEGRLLHSSILPLNSQSNEFRVDYPSGVYFVQLRSGSRIHATKKLVVQ